MGLAGKGTLGIDNRGRDWFQGVPSTGAPFMGAPTRSILDGQLVADARGGQLLEQSAMLENCPRTVFYAEDLWQALEVDDCFGHAQRGLPGTVANSTGSKELLDSGER
jgi:hypothetical protein